MARRQPHTRTPVLPFLPSSPGELAMLLALSFARSDKVQRIRIEVRGMGFPCPLPAPQPKKKHNQRMKGPDMFLSRSLLTGLFVCLHSCFRFRLSCCGGIHRTKQERDTRRCAASCHSTSPTRIWATLVCSSLGDVAVGGPSLGQTIMGSTRAFGLCTVPFKRKKRPWVPK